MKLIDLSGQKFGRLYVASLSPERSKAKGAQFNCICDCGTEKLILGSHLRLGRVVSCGCARRERLATSGIKHGMCGTGAWHSWRDMMKRCYSQKSAHYHHYGGRGIEVCQEWRSFEGFHKSMGDRPIGMSIEREDVDGNYEPGNCKWIPLSNQQENKRNSLFVVLDGERMCLSVACKKLGISYQRTRDRIKKLGWDFEKAISEPKKINGEIYA
jgi:hypothetical protein